MKLSNLKLSHMMTVKAIVCLVFGPLFVLLPQALLELYGVRLGAGGVFVARLYGASLFGSLAISWSARTARGSEALRAIVLGFFIYDAIAFFVALAAQFSGVMNALGWSAVAIYLLLTLGFGYFQFKPGAP